MKLPKQTPHVERRGREILPAASEQSPAAAVDDAEPAAPSLEPPPLVGGFLDVLKPVAKEVVKKVKGD